MKIVNVLVLWIVKISTSSDVLAKPEPNNEELIVITNYNPQNVAHFENMARLFFLILHQKIILNEKIKTPFNLEHYIGFAKEVKDENSEVLNEVMDLIGIEIMNYLFNTNVFKNGSFTENIQKLGEGTFDNAKCLASNRKNCAIHNACEYDLAKRYCKIQDIVSAKISKDSAKNKTDVRSYHFYYLYYCYLRCLEYLDLNQICIFCLFYDFYIIYIEKEKSKQSGREKEFITEYNITKITLLFYNDLENEAESSIINKSLFSYGNVENNRCHKEETPKKIILYFFDQLFDIPNNIFIDIDNYRRIAIGVIRKYNTIIGDLFTRAVENFHNIILLYICFNFDVNLYMMLPTENLNINYTEDIEDEGYECFYTSLDSFYWNNFKDLKKRMIKN